MKPSKLTGRATAKTSAAKKATGGVEGTLAALGARLGTNQAKLLARLARDIGRPVPVAALSEAVYGQADAPRAPLAMVMGDVCGWLAIQRDDKDIERVFVHFLEGTAR